MEGLIFGILRYFIDVICDLSEPRGQTDDVTGELLSSFLSNMARGFENICEIFLN